MLLRRSALLWFLLCLLYPVLVAGDERPCTIHDGDNFFDLNSLKASKDYQFTSPGGHSFTLNVCKSVSHDTWNLQVPHPENVGGFIRRDRGDFSIGEANTTLQMKTGHPLLLLEGGSVCPKSELQASTAIQFVCDTSVFAAGKPELVAQLPDDEDTACSFFIEWRTHYACPHGERGFWSGLVVILFTTMLVFSMLYIVFRTLYNRYALHLRGFDQIPTAPRHLSDFFSTIGDCFSSASFGSSRLGLNLTSHHWGSSSSGPARDIASRLGGSRFGSGSREEEEAILAGETDLEDNVEDEFGNWRWRNESMGRA